MVVTGMVHILEAHDVTIPIHDVVSTIEILSLFPGSPSLLYVWPMCVAVVHSGVTSATDGSVYLLRVHLCNDDPDSVLGSVGHAIAIRTT